MNRINPAKLLLSKWTAARPQHKEKHFLVTKLLRDDEGDVQEIELEAVMSHRVQRLAWQTLQSVEDWKIGWK
ncbi:TIGR02450 family Trp-rich protein [Pseudomonas yamanorum]